MVITPLELAGAFIIEPQVFHDHRGFFYESFNARRFADATGVRPIFVQDNHSRSVRNVLRGLHYQIRQPQGKLVCVVAGEVYDVCVDLRQSSPTFGRWHGIVLSAGNRRRRWIPEGFAHGFLALSEHADVLYKVSDYWAPEHERCIRWDDPDLAIDWPLHGEPILSAKDATGRLFHDAEYFA